MKNRLEKIIISVFLLVFAVGGCIWSGTFRYAGGLVRSAAESVRLEKRIAENSKDVDVNSLRNVREDGTLEPIYKETAQVIEGMLPFKNDMINLNGTFTRTAGMKEVFKDDGLYMFSNGYISGVYPQTDTDYESEQVIAFKTFLDEHGISFLYVNEPVKYSDDGYVVNELGIETCINDNADRFLQRIKTAGIECIDLRETLPGSNSFDWFYRTDHHWTVRAAKDAACTIAGKLNESFGYDIDLSLYDDKNMNEVKYENAWLGEQGKKTGATYSGLDDFVYISPSYETLFDITVGDETHTGSFDEVLVNTSIFLPENNTDVYSAASWHYAYNGNLGHIVNDLDDSGKKILVLGDSYDAVTNTFLALGVSEAEGIVMRDYTGSIRDYIEEKDFDTVIMAYAEFMIGAHEDETNANYRMFDLD